MNAVECGCVDRFPKVHGEIDVVEEELERPLVLLVAAGTPRQGYRRGAWPVRHAADAIRATVAEANLQADLLTSLGFFGRLVYPHLNMLQLIGREYMKESKFIRELFAEEFQEGHRTAIRAVLEERFGKEAAKAVAPLLADITDERRFSRLLRLAVRCAGLEEFRASLTQP
jgi:hypothetical protein